MTPKSDAYIRWGRCTERQGAAPDGTEHGPTGPDGP
jgi:hypothetical protein